MRIPKAYRLNRVGWLYTREQTCVSFDGDGGMGEAAAAVAELENSDGA